MRNKKRVIDDTTKTVFERSNSRFQAQTVSNHIESTRDYYFNINRWKKTEKTEGITINPIIYYSNKKIHHNQ